MKARFNKIRSFFNEVVEEFNKCTKPSKAELKESTVVVVATMAILGVFIFASDFVINSVLGFVLTH